MEKQIIKSAAIIVIAGIFSLTAIQAQDAATIKAKRVQTGDPATQTVSGPELPALESINVNEADTTTLKTLPGVGSVLALRIVEFRANYGGFLCYNELPLVKGIGDAKLAKIRPYITLGFPELDECADTDE